MTDVNGAINGLQSIFTLCLWTGGVGLCLLLIVTAVLRWLAPSDTRAQRLNRLALFAAAILCFMGLPAIWSALDNVLAPGTDGGGVYAATSHVEVFVGIFSLMTKLLLLGTVMASFVVLVLVIVLFLGHGLTAIFTAGTKETKSLKQELKGISSRLSIIMKSPILIAVITWGILALFVTLPFLMGSFEQGDLAETWKSGVCAIASFGSDAVPDSSGPGTDEGTEKSDDVQTPSGELDKSPETQNSSKKDGENHFYQALIKYILLTVIVLGVAFAVFKLLYSIILRTFTVETANDLIDEYSGAIGVLSVGVAMLWTLQGNNVDALEAPGRLPGEFLKAFVIVMVIVALIILTLEIIRLLLDMREKLIREEARYLFVALVGEITLLLLSAVNAVYEAANHAMGHPNDDSLTRVQHLIKKKIVNTMEKHISGLQEYKRTFSAFSETVCKDSDKEEY